MIMYVIFDILFLTRWSRVRQKQSLYSPFSAAVIEITSMMDKSRAIAKHPRKPSRSSVFCMYVKTVESTSIEKAFGPDCLCLLWPISRQILVCVLAIDTSNTFDGVCQIIRKKRL